jgi:hypothetical protein
VEARFTRQGDTPALAGAQQNHGTFELAQGELEAARDLFDRSIVNQCSQRLRRSIAWTNIARAEVLAALGEGSQAHALLDEARSELGALGEPGGLQACAVAAKQLLSGPGVASPSHTTSKGEHLP